MADPPLEEIDIVMARAVTLPITDFNPGTTPRLDGKEERLKAMISNLDAHQNIRNRITDATFEEVAARETRPEIFAHTPTEVLAAYESLLRRKEYEEHAAESRKLLVDTLRRYEDRGGGADPRRQSTDGGIAPRAPVASMTPMTPVAPMASMMGSAMEGVERTGVAPTAPMMANATPTTTSNIDASRDPRRR